MLDAAQRAFDALHSWLFETAVQPLLFDVGASNWLADAYPATEWFLLGVVQIMLLYAVLRPLEVRFAAERWSGRHGVGVDVIDTLPHRLGAFALLVFVLFKPLADGAASWLRGHEFTPFNLDALWPGVTDVPVVGFAIYLVVLDLLDYGLHRAQHRLRWWWALHYLQRVVLGRRPQPPARQPDPRRRQGRRRAGHRGGAGAVRRADHRLARAAEHPTREPRLDLWPARLSARQPGVPPRAPRNRRRTRRTAPGLQLRGAVSGVGRDLRQRGVPSHDRADRHPRSTGRAEGQQPRLRRWILRQQWLGLRRMFDPAA